jgi:lysophospholipid acyltransferase (LPLAT)-like uncharacterized protein
MRAFRESRRRIVRSERLHRALCYAIQLYIRLVYATNRWTHEGAEHTRRMCDEGRPFVGAFWHGRMMMIPVAWRRMAPMHILISTHRDGRIIADVIAHFGVQSVAGSTGRGGGAALRALVKLLAAGDCVAITPDGPRGPAMVASSGIVNVARLARVPIIPIAFATSRRRIMHSWDHMHLALPFGRGIFVWGEPIEIDHDLDEVGVERARQLVEGRLREMTVLADSRVGHGPAPAPSCNPTGGIDRAPELAAGKRP